MVRIPFRSCVRLVRRLDIVSSFNECIKNAKNDSMTVQLNKKKLYLLHKNAYNEQYRSSDTKPY